MADIEMTSTSTMTGVPAAENELDMLQLGIRAKEAGRLLAKATTEQKNNALLAIADALLANRASILEANQLDLEDARTSGMAEWMIDRLNIQKRLESIVDDVRNVITLSDPVGRIYDERILDNGLKVSRRRTPFGVLGVIYEARPNVTVDIASLALKTSNAVILRGGKETLRSNIALVKVLREALAASGLPEDAVQLITSPDRKYIMQMLKLHQYIDMIIPRGGASLHEFCRENSTIPVIIGGIGICHYFVDETAKLDDALKIIHNAKTQRPSVCNSLDTVLVHQAIAQQFLPQIVEHLAPAGVTFRAEPRALEIVSGMQGVEAAGPEDFDTEWLALILGLKVVNGLEDALAHIRQHSTQHSDGILTQDMDNANAFLNEVDSAAVFLNASTRFNDGAQLGLGAEVAVSTQKMHARGPMALEELTTYKWVIVGDGQVRS
jgi:glutamate-5-semialdehyde dehydrogenase